MTTYELEQLTSVLGPRRAQGVVDNRTDYDDIDPYETEESWILRSIGAR